jgi:drug/metabolite transporter (DMT)-like permease
VVAAALLGILGLVLVGAASRWLLWLYRMRKLSDVTGTVVARDRQFTGKGHWTYPVVEFTTRDGTQIRRTFR